MTSRRGHRESTSSATWTPLAIGGRTTLSGVFNYTDTDVTDLQRGEHFDADRIVTSLTLGLPRTRWNIGVNQTEDHWTLMARLHYYGAYWDREDARHGAGQRPMSYLYPAVLRANRSSIVEVGFPLQRCHAVGRRPEHLQHLSGRESGRRFAGVGNRYGQFGPFGFNGGYYYVRINYGWGASM